MKLWLAISAVLIGFVFYLDLSDERPSTERPSYPVMILGFDGMDPEFLDYFLAQGKLPHFQRLIDEGAYAPCQTFKPTKSVVLWTSVATGKRMEKHGIIDWQLISEDGQRKVLASGHSRRTEALWNIATKGGKAYRFSTGGRHGPRRKSPARSFRTTFRALFTKTSPRSRSRPSLRPSSRRSDCRAARTPT